MAGEETKHIPKRAYSDLRTHREKGLGEGGPWASAENLLRMPTHPPLRDPGSGGGWAGGWGSREQTAATGTELSHFNYSYARWILFLPFFFYKNKEGGSMGGGEEGERGEKIETKSPIRTHPLPWRPQSPDGRAGWRDAMPSSGRDQGCHLGSP